VQLCIIFAHLRELLSEVNEPSEFVAFVDDVLNASRIAAICEAVYL
jgi:hypothetical protein